HAVDDRHHSAGAVAARTGVRLHTRRAAAHPADRRDHRRPDPRDSGPETRLATGIPAGPPRRPGRAPLPAQRGSVIPWGDPVVASGDHARGSAIIETPAPGRIVIPRKIPSSSFPLWSCVYCVTFQPANVPIAAPASTSLAQCWCSYMRATPERVAAE